MQLKRLSIKPKVVDFRRTPADNSPLFTSGSTVERVRSILHRRRPHPVSQDQLCSQEGKATAPLPAETEESLPPLPILPTLYRGTVERKLQSIRTQDPAMRSEDSWEDHRGLSPLHPGHLSEALSMQSLFQCEGLLPQHPALTLYTRHYIIILCLLLVGHYLCLYSYRFRCALCLHMLITMFIIHRFSYCSFLHVVFLYHVIFSYMFFLSC